MRASTPAARRAAGSAALTSPSPPVFTRGVHSGVTKRTASESVAETAGDKVILAGDVGGTKILLEVGDLRSGRWVPALARRYLVADFPSLDQVLEVFLAEWASIRP